MDNQDPFQGISQNNRSFASGQPTQQPMPQQIGQMGGQPPIGQFQQSGNEEMAFINSYGGVDNGKKNDKKTLIIVGIVAFVCVIIAVVSAIVLPGMLNGGESSDDNEVNVQFETPTIEEVKQFCVDNNMIYEEGTIEGLGAESLTCQMNFTDEVSEPGDIYSIKYAVFPYLAMYSEDVADVVDEAKENYTTLYDEDDFLKMYEQIYEDIAEYLIVYKNTLLMMETLDIDAAEDVLVEMGFPKVKRATVVKEIEDEDNEEELDS